MRDSAEFENWQKEMKYKDKLEAMENMQRKKVEMELARDAAILAQEDKFKENHQTAAHMKELSKQNQLKREENLQ